MKPSSALEHNRFQVVYYRDPKRRAIRPVDTPYVRRHLDAVRRAARLGGAGRLLEVGSGTGRFTRLLLEAGHEVVANDLAPNLLDELRREEWARGGRLETLAGDLGELPRSTPERFERVVGFFVLHHLYDLDAAFAALAQILEPGGRVAFCEPNGYNPLFYLQVLLTPSMRWKAERGIRRMTARGVLAAMAGQGFAELAVERYGFFPPRLANSTAGRAMERFLERLRILEPVRAFQVFSGRLQEAR